MSKVIIPDRESLLWWVDLLANNPAFLKRHLPKMDAAWVREVQSILERVSFPYFKDDVHHKCAQIFYKIIKNHCLTDGNKRSAVIVLYLVYLLNNEIILTKPMSLRSLARRVASDKLIETPKIHKPEAVVSILETVFSQITHNIQSK